MRQLPGRTDCKSILKRGQDKWISLHRSACLRCVRQCAHDQIAYSNLNTDTIVSSFILCLMMNIVYNQTTIGFTFVGVVLRTPSSFVCVARRRLTYTVIVCVNCVAVVYNTYASQSYTSPSIERVRRHHIHEFLNYTVFASYLPCPCFVAHDVFHDITYVCMPVCSSLCRLTESSGSQLATWRHRRCCCHCDDINASFTTTLQQNKQELEDLFSHALQTPAAATSAADLSTSRSANVSTNELSSASFVTPPARKMQTGNDGTEAYSHITDQAELHNMVRLYHGQWF